MRFYAIQKLIPNIDYVHQNPEVQQLYKGMAEKFEEYKQTFMCVGVELA